MSRPSIALRRVWIVLVLPLLLYPLHIQKAESKGTSWEEKIAMRDGIRLAANIFIPEGPGPWPVVLTRTPYGKDGSGLGREEAEAFAARGYATVNQDCRGVGRSAGEQGFPFLTDGPDGYDTVEWIAKQPWSNGKVGMVGRSGYGIPPLLAATQAPPHLVCAFTMLASGDARRVLLYMGGAYRKEMADGWMYARGQGYLIPEIVARPIADPFWDNLDIVAQHPRIRIPICGVGGWYDVFLQGMIDNFVGLQKNGGGQAIGNQRLILAPIGHVTLQGEILYPPYTRANLRDDQIRWFDYWLKGVRTGIANQPAVRYYVMGDAKDPAAPGNEWRTTDSWPLPAKITAYYLQPKGKLDPAPPRAPENFDEYLYDPKKPVPTVGGQNLMIAQGPNDQRAITARPDYLRFETPPLPTAIEVTGRVYADLWVETDAPDTDFMAKLVDVYPDGYEALVLDAPIRLRYRQGLDKEVFMKPGEVVRARIDLWSTSLVFNRGHKIAVHVSSSNNPRFEPNPNTGKPLRLDSEKRVAVNRLHHDASHPSCILLPIVRIYEAK
jgi:predicted acyl esterase